VRLVVPNYKVKNFDTEEDLYEYIASPYYNTNSTTKGVCMGIKVDTDEDEINWHMKSYFTDATFLGTKLGVGVPPQ
jgi:hypothetical protein